MDVSLIAGPTAEPVSVAQLMQQMGFGTIADGTLNDTLNGQLTDYLLAARHQCENYCRRVFMTQRWLASADGFEHKMWLPNPPLQSIDWFKYVDTSGTVQTLLRDTSYGSNQNTLYGYQIDRGSGTMPAQVTPTWAQPWPPTRRVHDCVLIQMRCGYGGPIIASMTAGSAVLTVANGVTFNPDDAPILAGEIGTAITVNGAGPVTNNQAANLTTTIASVNGSGVATLAVAATTTVQTVAGWAGMHPPSILCKAILLLAQWLYEQGSIANQDIPPHIINMLNPYRNLVA